MTTPRETAAVIKMAYAQWPHIDPDENVADLWHTFLAEHPIDIVSPALKALLRNAVDYPPTIAQLMDRIEGVERNPAPKDRPAVLAKHSTKHPPGCHCDRPDTTTGLIPTDLGLVPCPGIEGDPAHATEAHLAHHAAEVAQWRRPAPLNNGTTQRLRIVPPPEGVA